MNRSRRVHPSRGNHWFRNTKTRLWLIENTRVRWSCHGYEKRFLLLRRCVPTFRKQTTVDSGGTRLNWAGLKSYGNTDLPPTRRPSRSNDDDKTKKMFRHSKKMKMVTERLNRVLHDPRSLWCRPLGWAEARTGVCRHKLFIMLVFAVTFLLNREFCGPTIGNVIGFVYPAYKTMQQTNRAQPRPKVNIRWFVYWLTFVVILLLERYAPLVPRLVPFYHLNKAAFLVWCAAPIPGNGSVFMRKLLVYCFYEDPSVQRDIDRQNASPTQIHHEIAWRLRTVATSTDERGCLRYARAAFRTFTPARRRSRGSFPANRIRPGSLRVTLVFTLTSGGADRGGVGGRLVCVGGGVKGSEPLPRNVFLHYVFQPSLTNYLVHPFRTL